MSMIAFALGCASPFPVEPGYILKVVPVDQPVSPHHLDYETTLQIRWLGTACYSIQLADASVITDPFVSHHGLLHSLLWGTLRSHETVVKEKVALVPYPSAALVGHSHWDHLLDLPEMFREGAWDKTTIIGSKTTKNILGYDESLCARVRVADTSGQWREIKPVLPSSTKIEYRAMEASHAPQFLCLLFYPGEVVDERREPPTKACHFQVGQPFSYLVRLSRGETSFTVFVMTSASKSPHGLPKADLLPIDVAILCVPSHERADGYPEDVLKTLKPRFVVLAHFNDFTGSNDEPPETLATADVDGFLRQVQRHARATGIEEILVPEVDAVMTFR